MKLNIHYYQHVNHEGPGVIQNWCYDNGHNMTRTNFRVNDDIPNPDLYDVLIIMGAHFSVHDTDKYPWLIKEKRSIDRALNDGKKVLGICLGAQLIAEVLGAEVKKSEFKELGWHKIKFSKEGMNSKLFNHYPQIHDMFHWHGETFNLPDNCMLVAESEACQNQIFQYGELAVGFQCHPELSEYHIGRMLEKSSDCLTDGKYVNSKEEILENIHFAKK